jgi:hypothetical protein
MVSLGLGGLKSWTELRWNFSPTDAEKPVSRLHRAT